MRRYLKTLALSAAICLPTLTHGATDDAFDDFARANGTALGATTGGAYPWFSTAAPDGTGPILENGRLVFRSIRNGGGDGTGIGSMAATVDRLLVEDVRVGFDLYIDSGTGTDDQWVGVAWRQIGLGFDLSGYFLLIRKDGSVAFFSPSLGSVLYQGNIGAFSPGVAKRIEVESIGSEHRILVDGDTITTVTHSGPAYARISFVTLHPEDAATPGTFERSIDNVTIENLRSFDDGFPTFTAPDSELAGRMNRLFRYHYGYVLNPGPIRGVQQVNWREWNTLSTLFVDTATHPSGPHDINAELRENLLGIPLDDEGYVFTYDPNSPAADFFPTFGWPFPSYANSGTESDRELGRRGKAFLWDQRVDTIGWSATVADSSTPGVSGWALSGDDEVVITSPAISRPASFLPWEPYRPLETFHSPYLAILGVPEDYEIEINWRVNGQSSWLSENSFISTGPATPGATNRYLPMHRHANWYGPSETNRQIVQMRMTIRRPGGGPVDLTLRRLQSHYDGRQSTNNSHFVLGSVRYYNWTGDEDFLIQNMPRMRAAMEHMHAGLSGAALGLLEVSYIGHDGRPGGFNQDFGRGIGSNYYDILPFGHRDAYGTAYYLGAVRAMSELEEYVAAHGGLGLPAPQRDATSLNNLATGIQEAVNAYFWSEQTGRFVGTVDTTDVPYDFGFTQVNIEGMFYGFGTPQQRASIFSWLDGNRIVNGDTSTGSDIYAWEFAPRTSTLKNSTWYNWFWPNSKRNAPFGDQIYDGGGVLYLSFYDVMTRLLYQSPEAAFTRFTGVTDWFAEVEAEGGYIAYYANREGDVQGDIRNGQGEGGLGLHLEFVESTMFPTAFLYGFIGLDAKPDALTIAPRLPASLEWAGMESIHYRNMLLDVRVEAGGPRIELTRRSAGSAEVPLRLEQLQPDTPYLIGLSTVVDSDANGRIEHLANLSENETLVIQPLADAPQIGFFRVLFRDNFLTSLTPPDASFDLSLNKALPGGRQSGELPELINNDGWGWSIYGTTSFTSGNGWDLRAQENWPVASPAVDTYTLRFRNDVPGGWATVTPDIGFNSFFAEGAFRVRVQLIHAHLDNPDAPVNDRWAGISFGEQPDIRFPAFAANAGVILFPGGDFTIFSDGAVLASGNVPVPANGAFALELIVNDNAGSLAINGTVVAADLDFGAIVPAWIGLTVNPGNNPSVFSATQLRFDKFSVATLGEFAGASFTEWADALWSGTLVGISGLLDDPDGDGVTNLAEYVFGGDPLTPNTASSVVLEAVEFETQATFSLHYQVRDGLTDYRVFPQLSDGLVTWLPENASDVDDHFLILPTPGAEGFMEIEAVDTTLNSGDDRRFYRVRIEPIE